MAGESAAAALYPLAGHSGETSKEIRFRAT